MIWQGHVPVSELYGDRYYAEDGLAEARYVYLGACGLPERYRAGFSVAELGFGTGLNMAAALRAWREAGVPGALRYVAFERHPLGRAETARALAAFPGIAEEAAEIAEALPEEGATRRIRLADLDAEIHVGDARARLPAWDGMAEAIFLDGFAPATNPAMWEAPLLAAAALRLAPGGILSSFTAAGHVRRALAAAGLEVERREGFGRKRHMTVARRPSPG